MHKSKTKELPTKRELRLLEMILNSEYCCLQIKDAFMAPSYEHLMSLVVKGYLDLERDKHNIKVYLFQISDIVIDSVLDVRCYMNEKEQTFEKQL